MQIQPLIDDLKQLRLEGMAEALQQQADVPNSASLSFEDRLQSLILAEQSSKDAKRFQRLMRAAKLKIAANPEDVVYTADRGLDKSEMASLLRLDWVRQGRNVLVTGATGTGKTWIACCFGVQAARFGLRVAYRRVNRMLEDMEIGHDDGTLAKQRNQLAKSDLLILDDFGLTPLTPIGRSDLLEVLDDRVGSGATIIAGQMPVKNWHAYIEDPAIADAIMDRVSHNGTRLTLSGSSMRGRES